MTIYARWVFECQDPTAPACYQCPEGWMLQGCAPDDDRAFNLEETL